MRKKNPEFIKLEYKKIVELISQKYLILMDQLKQNNFNRQQIKEHEDILKEQYKDDVISIAVAIDETLESKS